MKEKIIYKDAAGNKLLEKYIKTKEIWQISAKNKEGRIINPSGLRTMIKKANLSYHIPVPKKKGIHIVEGRLK